MSDLHDRTKKLLSEHDAFAIGPRAAEEVGGLTRHIRLLDRKLKDQEKEARELRDALSKAAKSPDVRKVVIVVDGGLVQEIVSNSPQVAVLIKDYDIDGSDCDLGEDARGKQFVPIHGPDDVDSAFVEQSFQQAESATPRTPASDEPSASPGVSQAQPTPPRRNQP